MAPNRETKSGTVRIADSTNFLVSKTVAASMVTIKPGGVREMHWHPNADEWLYILKGTGRATVFNRRGSYLDGFERVSWAARRANSPEV
jgi:oxalate decarboxylase